MRVLSTIILVLFFSLSSLSQTFNGSGGAVPGSSTIPTCFPINVTGVGVINTGTVGLASVCFSINHTITADLEITLTAPDGTMVPLSIQNGGGTGINYTNTCFTATASSSIKFGSAPYTGNFLPEGWLGAVNNGQNANGNWQLCVRDRRTPGNSGALVNWSLTFSSTPAPMPPPMPACANTLPANSTCANATLVCDFNGQCGNTSGSTVQDWPGSGLNNYCFGIDNNAFIRFVAGATTATFSVWVPTSIQTNQQGGIQMLFFSGTCNSGPVNVISCYPRILPYSGSGQPLVSVVTANNLIPGNTYYLMIDGANGDNCTFTIAANSGVNILNVSPANPAVCTGGSINLTASGGNGIYSWSPATGLSGTSGATVSSSPAATTTYTVTSSTVTGCPVTTNVTVTVNPLPATPVIVVSQPTCTTPTGTISITSPIIPGIEYSVGGSLQSSPVFSGLTPGSYIVTVRDPVTSCSSPGVPVSINSVPVGPATPTATVTTQPSCIAPTGTITITAPVGAGLQYSINGGPYQTSPVFTGLVPNSYTITAQNAGGCTSPASAIFVINAAPATVPIATIGSIVHPTCLVPTGTVTVSAPIGAGYQYMLSGGTYQSSPVFTAVQPGMYTVTVQNAAGCTSLPSAVFVLPWPPPAPVAPTGIVTQQSSCAFPFGRFVFSTPIGAQWEYSINGTAYQSSTVFDNIPPGNYNATVRDINTGCVSASFPFTVNGIPVLAAPANINSIQPTCNTITGAIIITPPAGTDLEYSINGTSYQSSPTFNNVAPGNYSVTIRNTVTGCVSVATPITINAVPPNPAQPTFTGHLTCTAPTWTIIITSPLGASLEYSFDGINYQSSPIFQNISPGNYVVTIRDIITGCLSAPHNHGVGAAPMPSAPTATVTAQPTCSVPTGSIVFTAPVGAGIEYSIDGTTYQTSPVFTQVPPGTYQVFANAGGCSSPTLGLTVNPADPAPATPVIAINPLTCNQPLGSVTVTSPLGAGLEYSRDGLTYQASPSFNQLPAGNYNITVRFTGTSCSSPITIAQLAAPDPGICVTGNDIYFPSAFTPNGDLLNDGFGPGPGTSLMAVTDYTLRVFNRYGELVFNSSQPMQQWDGRYKGKMLANNSYTWVASYRFKGEVRVRKGVVVAVR